MDRVETSESENCLSGRKWEPGDYRTPYRHDYGRIIHSYSFRKLEHKTQMFPGHESDYFRNRLTHSLEVAQIAKSIALKLKNKFPILPVEPDVCEVSGLLHDLGHPPFGHNGEKALNECMAKCGGFEGNAQTLRIITKLEEKVKRLQIDEAYTEDGDDLREGLDLTVRSIASILKYDMQLPNKNNKGYYFTESNIVKEIKSKLHFLGRDGEFKTIECSIMDLADDIANATYDIDDAFKAGFLCPLSMISADNNVFKRIADKMNADNIVRQQTRNERDIKTIIIKHFDDFSLYTDLIRNSKIDNMHSHIFILAKAYEMSKKIASDGYFRTKFTSSLIDEFINGINLIYNPENPILSTVEFDKDTKIKVNIFKNFIYEYIILSPEMRIVENRGYHIVKELFILLSEKHDGQYLPEDYQNMYKILLKIDKREEKNISDNNLKLWKHSKRIICDFIASMTDRHAMEYYGRLNSDNPQSFFKPIS